MWGPFTSGLWPCSGRYGGCLVRWTKVVSQLHFLCIKLRYNRLYVMKDHVVSYHRCIFVFRFPKFDPIWIAHTLTIESIQISLIKFRLSTMTKLCPFFSHFWWFECSWPHGLSLGSTYAPNALAIYSRYVALYFHFDMSWDSYTSHDVWELNNRSLSMHLLHISVLKNDEMS